MNLSQNFILENFNSLIALQDFSNKHYQFKNKKYIGDVIMIIYDSENPPENVSELSGPTGWVMDKNSKRTKYKYLIFPSDSIEVETLIDLIGNDIHKLDLLSISISSEVEGMLNVVLNGSGL
jgi:hypothetical protein